MAQQYHASDSDTGLAVSVTGEFPPDPDDRVRIARTTNLFTRLMATILSTENDFERRERFKAIETQLELADALIRGDAEEVQNLIRSTLGSMGITEEQLNEAQQQLRSQLESIGGDPSAIEQLFGTPSLGGDDGLLPLEEPPLDDRPSDDSPIDDRPLDDRL